jgi:hypothetical protein
MSVNPCDAAANGAESVLTGTSCAEASGAPAIGKRRNHANMALP